MRNESLMWRKVRPCLVAAKLDPVRVENPIHPGTPDVNLANGNWIELKCVLGWPARESNLLRIQHFTPQQRVWLYRRWKYAPGSTYLLLEVRADAEWLLFNGDVAAKIVGRATTSEHRLKARVLLKERELTELPKILMHTEPRSQSAPARPVCTGRLAHNEHTVSPLHDHTVCPLHDAEAVDR